MSFIDWINQVPNLVGSFTPQLALVVFLLSLVGEAFVISIPLVFEFIFITAGYQMSIGVLPVVDMLLLALLSQLGRQIGALVLFGLSHKSSSFLGKFITRRFPRKNILESTPFKFLRHIDKITPFGVAIGRLLWLRIPLTLILGARRKLKTLILGIAISSTIYEGIYIGLGAIVGKTTKESATMGSGIIIWLAVSLGIVYVVALSIRFAINRMKKRRNGDKPGQNSTDEQNKS
jgi:membrane-associated protein